MKSNKKVGAKSEARPSISEVVAESRVVDARIRANNESKSIIKQLSSMLAFDHDYRSTDVPKVLYSVAFLMDWLTGYLDHPLDEWISHAFAIILRECADIDAAGIAMAKELDVLAKKLEDEIEKRDKAKTAAVS